ncbi:MAG TPA: sulfite exporter TauE/SafE family protein [Armatimonadota bacterium]
MTDSAYLVAGMAGGLASTLHCTAMCGGFPLLLGRAAGRRRVTLPLLYVLGKSVTYALLGALAAGLGGRILGSALLAGSRQAASIALGTVVVLLGLGMLGLRLPLPRLPGLAGKGADLLAPLTRRYLAEPGHLSALLLGLGTGYLPCPATLAMLGVCAGSGAPAQGLALMLGMGLGTGPGLLAVGLGGGAVLSRLKRSGLRPLGALVVLMGLVTVLRSQEVFHRYCCPKPPPGKAASSAKPCPFCRTGAATKPLAAPPGP